VRACVQTIFQTTETKKRASLSTPHQLSASPRPHQRVSLLHTVEHDARGAGGGVGGVTGGG